MTAPKKYLIVVAGPTAVGKTEIALRLAEHLQTAILSADSRQCFRELNIGTAKPSDAERKHIPHYFINTHSIHEDVSAASFEAYALDVLQELFERHDVVVVSGGTGLYIHTLIHGLDAMPQVAKEIEEEVLQAYQLQGFEWLRQEIEQADPLYAAEGVMNNPARMLRALSFIKAHKSSIINFQTGTTAQRNFEVIGIGLELPRELLYQRINTRVDEMVSNGLIEEARMFFDQQHLKTMQTVGYQEFYVFGDEFPTEEVQLKSAIEKIKQHTRNYAKRQLTWFKNKENFAWFSPNQYETILSYVMDRMQGG